MNTTDLIIICIASISVIINIILLISTRITRNQIRSSNDDIKFYMYEIMRREANLSSIFDDMNETVESLTTGFNDVQRSFHEAINQKLDMKHYPLPEEIRQIEGVMLDQIDQIVGLASTQRIPNKDMYETIITNMCKTFPDVDVEYLVTKLTSYIETSNIVKREE